MAKILKTSEAEEIISTLLDEYGYNPVKIKYVKPSFGDGYYEAWNYRKKVFKIFKWKITFKKLAIKHWINAYSLERLVMAAEREMAYLQPQVEMCEAIRQRHATRLLDKEMQK